MGRTVIGPLRGREKNDIERVRKGTDRGQGARELVTNERMERGGVGYHEKKGGEVSE